MSNFIIFDHEERDPIKSLIWESIKNYSSGKFVKIFARKCNLSIVSSQDSKHFLQRCHLQGNYYSTVNLGLYYKDNLVALMTFSKPRFNKKYEWELIRYVSELNTQIIGGASKLLSYFEKQYKPKTLISYADKRYSHGNLYLKLGFTKIGESNSNYWYVKGDLILNRIACQKHKLQNILGSSFDPNKTEKQNMFDAGFSIIKDKGNLVYEKCYPHNMSYNENYYFTNRDKFLQKSNNRYQKIKQDEESWNTHKEKNRNYRKLYKDKQKLEYIHNDHDPIITNFIPYNSYVVYKIDNLIKNKSYIGITSKSLITRFNEHKGNSTPLGKAIKKYGSGNFQISILHICDNHESAINLEIEEIQNYNTFKSGYNSSSGGESTTLAKMSDETKEKLSIKNSICTYTLYNIETKERIVIQSLRKFCSERNLSMQNMSPVVNGRRNSYKNWICESNIVNNQDKILMLNKNKIISEDLKQKIRSKHILFKWKIITPNNDEFIIDSLTKYCNDNNLHFGNMRSVSIGKQSHCCGYKVYKLNKDTLEVIGNGPKQLEKKPNIYWAKNIITNEYIEFASMHEFCIDKNLGYKYMHQFISTNIRNNPYKNWIAGRLY